MNWTGTQLWKELLQRQGAAEEAVQVTLRQCMPDIQTLLTSAGTSPNDFTLHDAGHASRVAERMHDIMQDTVPGLSAYELALALLAAYLHDIGMSPERGKVNSHYKYLLTGEDSGLQTNELDAFNSWLDDSESGITRPITGGTATAHDIEVARELVTHYCRYRHNEWSAEWIRHNLSGIDSGMYRGFVHDLVRLCESHHQGRKELEGGDFDPRIVGQDGGIVHLRYLACVLRIADILDFDPERTPDVILRHRDIAQDSLIYWHKDHAIGFAREGNRLIVSARPSNAIVHKAIEDTCDQIDNELQLCRILADNTHFEVCPGLEKTLPHKWTLVSATHKSIEPRDNVYEYINGAFRPNTPKLLEMLSGIELYGNRLTAIRELLQNAFDAVLEQIAYQRLSSKYPSDRKVEDAIGQLHRVELRLEKRKDEFWLICTDTGVGMNKRIICNHLLISGQPRRHDILGLERECLKAGFNLRRTGRFGIGVLSYFMIADHLVITTHRSIEPKDGDPTGWVFETHGIGSFGELRKDAVSDRGSRVELRLRREVVGDDIKQWYGNLRKYLVSLLIIVPCEFQLNSAIPECESLLIKSGWRTDSEELCRRVVTGFRDKRSNTEAPITLLSQDARNKEVARGDRIEEIRERIRACLQWIADEGELPDGLGRFRIRIPYFELKGGRCLVFLDDEVDGGRLKVKSLPAIDYYASTDHYAPELGLSLSWKGMRTGSAELPFRDHRINTAQLNLDLHDDASATPQVSRDTIRLNAKGQNAAVWLRERARRLREDFVRENTDSVYSYLNSRVISLSTGIKDPQWLDAPDGKTGDRFIRPIKPPVTISLPWRYGPLPKGLQYRGKMVLVLPAVGTQGDSHHIGIPAIGFSTCPDRIVVTERTYRLAVVPMWLKPLHQAASRTSSFLKAAFPPKWQGVTGVIFEAGSSQERGLVWNKAFPPVRHVDERAWQWAAGQDYGADPLGMADVVLKDRARAIAWVLHYSCTVNRDIWNGLTERAPEFLAALWDRVFPSSRKSSRGYKPIVCWIDDLSDSRLRMISPSGWKVYKWSSGNEVLKQYMPDPGPEWTLYRVGNGSQ